MQAASRPATWGGGGALPVSQICRRTVVSESPSTTRLVMKEAPTVDVIWEGLKLPLQKRSTRLVLPTPWEPRTTILASREDMVGSATSTRERANRCGRWRPDCSRGCGCSGRCSWQSHTNVAMGGFYGDEINLRCFLFCCHGKGFAGRGERASFGVDNKEDNRERGSSRPAENGEGEGEPKQKKGMRCRW